MAETIKKTIEFKVEGLGEIEKAVQELKKLSTAAEDTDKKAEKSKGGFLAMASGVGAALLTIQMAKKAFQAFTDALGKTKAGNEAMESLKKSFGMVMDSLINGLMPVVQELAKMFAWAAPYIAAAVQAMAQVVSTVFFAIKSVITGVITGILAYWEILLNTLAKGAALIPGVGKKMSEGLKAAADAVGKTSENMAVQSADSFNKMISSATTWGQDQEKVMTDAEKKRLENKKKADEKLAEQQKKAAEKEAEENKKAAEKKLEDEKKALQDSLQAYRSYQDAVIESLKSANEIRSGLYENLAQREIGRIKDEYEQKRTQEKYDYEKQKQNLELAAISNKELASTLNADLEALKRDHIAEMAVIDEEDSAARKEREEKDAEEKKERDDKAAKDDIDRQKKAEEEKKRIRDENMANVVEAANQFSNIISTITDMQIDDVARWADAQKDKARSTIKNQEQLKKELERIDKEAAKKEKEVKEKEKAMAIVMAIINTAVAVTKAMDKGPPVGFIMAALTAAAGAAQIALIASQSFAQGGIVEGSSTSGDNTLVRANAGEAIMTRAQQDRLLAIADGRASGGASVTVGGDTIVINGSADASTVESIRQTRTEQLAQMREMMLDLQYRGQMI